MITVTLKRFSFFLFTLTLFSGVNGYAQQKTIHTMYGKSVAPAELTEGIKKIMEQYDVPGLSIAVINDNALVYHNALGVSNIETKEPVDGQSIFEGASLSKPIFAYFALKMVEEGKLDLDRPLYEYLPHPGFADESQEDAKLITARMVLAHQTGMPNHAFGKKMKLAFKPGTGFEYSGEAYQYLAAVIGKQHGIGFKSDLNKLFEKKVTKPLKMPHSTFIWDNYVAQHKVYGHDEEDGTPKHRVPSEGYWDDGVFSAYSSLHSEAKEYAQFVIAMLKEEGLKPETFDEMLKEHTHFDKDNPLRKQVGQTGWGLGFAQKRTPEMTMHMHTGNNHDFQAYVMFVPEKNYGLVLFTNSGKMIQVVSGISQILGPQF
ncbi:MULTISPECIES: serine hydrolase domain-containing protein [Flagellimonas]|uniref:Beta-lactamase n=1 Tax=Allomuricauda ruestringensis (strain DSM 13258 / CIP 107369 / LMG 19739 / B1) TaxID=886377 RepID=G2PPW2_ALLRU|nr:MULTISPECIES: serine hydrolase domain-containing protein [Allomuricauda]AEM71540.1 beta-lactamase [Allomuricauda ruestringensis DSM 13258]MAU14117.1 serine hydrolase [Allomuricauda sp.]|tara:strand:- start:27620 stop:28738 length:1119 start_codon:yes stop_codon:yes gene_type:complete